MKTKIKKAAAAVGAKPVPMTPEEAHRQELRIMMAGEKLMEVGDHLSDLSDLLYQNQDTCGNSAVINGAENLLGHYAAFVQDMAKYLKGGAR